MRSPRSQLVALLVGLLAFAVTTPILAQDKGGEDNDERARALYKSADADYAAGRYEDAADKFSRAYELSKRPRLLFNLANTYERMGEYGKAADHLERYLESPKVKDVVSIRERIRRLRKAVERPQDESVRPGDGTGLAPAEGDPAGDSAADERELSEPAALERSKRDRPRRARWPSYTFMGVGAAAVAGSVLFGVAARGAADDATAFCSDSESGTLCLREADGALGREKRYAFLSDASTGVAVVSFGVALYLLLRPHKKVAPKTEVTVTPMWTPGAVGVGISGRL